MEENQLENQELASVCSEPENSVNSSTQEAGDSTILKQEEGQSIDPSSLILGKFKTQDDLIKAYQNLEKQQGTQANELGDLRKESAQWKDMMKLVGVTAEITQNPQAVLNVVQKYNSPEYFQDGAFRLLFQEAYKAFGTNIDADYFVGLLDNYVSNRIDAYERKKSAEAETQKVLGSIKFEKNNSETIKKAPKRLDEMSPKEINDMLDRLI